MTNLQLFFDDLVKLIEKLSNILSLMVQQRINYMFELILSVIKMIHSKCSCNYYIGNNVPVAIC